MQQVDFTTLTAACTQLQAGWIPGRLEQVYQRDRYTIALCLRTLQGRGWLTVAWHPQAARICLSDPPPRIPDTFTFSDQLRHQLNGLALVGIQFIAPWERVLDLQFARRPGDPILWHLYVEIMGKYSNVILTDAKNIIVTAAHQVGPQQSSVRPIQTGQPYEHPPALLGNLPSLSESQERWQERVSLVPGALKRQLLKSYRGLSPALVRSMIQAADLDPEGSTESLGTQHWQRLFQRWQEWLWALEDWGAEVQGTRVVGAGFTDNVLEKTDNLTKPALVGEDGVVGAGFTDNVLERTDNLTKPALVGEDGGGFSNIRVTTNDNSEKSPYKLKPGWTDDGYNVLGWGVVKSAPTVQVLLHRYYTDQLNRQEFSRLHNQLLQKVNSFLVRSRSKALGFEQRLQQSEQADEYRQQADLLMAHLQDWQPGMNQMTVLDFETNQPLTISLDPEKNAVQNAQALYKRHQKLKRARLAVVPLLQEVQAEVEYLEQVEASLVQIDRYTTPEDLQALQEIREELIGQGYLDVRDQRSRDVTEASEPYRYRTPSGFELLIGRNNRQNDQLTFRKAGDYDLWFHTQEIAGSHVLLRLDPGAVADEADLQFAADLAAHYSRGRQSDVVPVVYTEPKHVYKPKGAKPGMAIYKRERILWGRPQQAEHYRTADISG
ncbi:MAG: NFACT RNA binding domain-containing protein [Coleofasciculus sp. G1-WW12-02]|uniref:Rqc2 family fibronectin-binding protein n=1 Tax=unclassified Coleofasciculus TaxID=2692782 RepID=UPI003300520C